MPRIRCFYLDCIFIEDGICGAARIELDPDAGCMTYSQTDSVLDNDWAEEDEDDFWLDDDDF